VIACACEVSGVAGPVASCVSGPSGGGCGGEVEEFGEDGSGDLGSELEKGGASAWAVPKLDTGCEQVVLWLG
jgi:hypothetical protein